MKICYWYSTIRRNSLKKIKLKRRKTRKKKSNEDSCTILI